LPTLLRPTLRALRAGGLAAAEEVRRAAALLLSV